MNIQYRRDNPGNSFREAVRPSLTARFFVNRLLTKKTIPKDCVINKMNEKVAIMLGKNEGDESLDDDSSDADNVERLATHSFTHSLIHSLTDSLTH